MKKVIRPQLEKVYAGVNLSDNRIDFNWSEDHADDVIFLNENVSGELVEDFVRIIYAYEYNPRSSRRDRDAFRKYLKELYTSKSLDNPQVSSLFKEDIEEFVRQGVLALDSYASLDNFDVVVRTESQSDYSIIHLIQQCICNECHHVSLSFELIKQTYADVKFDVDKARKALQEDTFLSEEDIEREIQFTLAKFDQLKTSGQLFQMKRFVPKEIRSGFYDFLKFKDDLEKQAYMSLQGVDVLIYDDFLTSGSTIKEIARYLKSFNDSNTLTAFVLVKQH